MTTMIDDAAQTTLTEPGTEEVEETSSEAKRRDRLLAALTLIAGVGLMIGIPFALKEGAEFFLPMTAALVIAVALVPVLEWL
ncbi:MAG TPA: AI-2E family transporter, partial [Sphingomonas sp.]